MLDLADSLLNAVSDVIVQKCEPRQRIPWAATIIVATDRGGVITTHRFDIKNPHNGKPENAEAVDCRRGADRFMDCTVSFSECTSIGDTQSKQRCFVITSTKNVAKDEALLAALDQKALPQPTPIDLLIVSFTGHTVLKQRRIALNSGRLPQSLSTLLERR